MQGQGGGGWRSWGGRVKRERVRGRWYCVGGYGCEFSGLYIVRGLREGVECDCKNGGGRGKGGVLE